MRAIVGRRLRFLADRVDPDGAPRMTNLRFTIEHRRGLVVREDGKGCPLWYYGMEDYARAHSEADTEHMIVDWQTGTARFGR